MPELATLIAGAKLVLTNDSLPIRLADATCTPSVILYLGTEYESQWQPRYSPFPLLRRSTPYSHFCKTRLYSTLLPTRRHSVKQRQDSSLPFGLSLHPRMGAGDEAYGRSK